MKTKLSIINVEGSQGSGQTTQVNVLAKYFKDIGVSVFINGINKDIESTLEGIKLTQRFLEKNNDGLVLSDGSIVKMIVIDMLNGVPYEKIMLKYANIINGNQYLAHNYNMANILLVPENIEMCKNRLIKRNKLMGEESSVEFEPNYQRDITNGIVLFNDHVVSQQLEFDIIKISEDDSILEIRDNILKLLKEKFNIK